MIRVDAEELIALAALVERGEIEVGRVDINPRGTLYGVFVPGIFATKARPTSADSSDPRKI